MRATRVTPRMTAALLSGLASKAQYIRGNARDYSNE